MFVGYLDGNLQPHSLRSWVNLRNKRINSTHRIR